MSPSCNVPLVAVTITKTCGVSPKPSIRFGSVFENRRVNADVFVFAGAGMVTEVDAFAGTVNSDESKIVTNKVEDFLFQELLMLNPNSVKSCH